MDSGNTPGGEPLNIPEFHALGTETSSTCSICQKPFEYCYYEMNGMRICESCKGATERKLRSGSGFVRFLKAGMLGGLAAILGSVIYGGVTYFTDREFALIAILVGFLVGSAVRLGSERRGGKGYQFLAVLLTYISIVGGYVPLVLQGLQEADFEEIAREEDAAAAGEVELALADDDSLTSGSVASAPMKKKPGAKGNAKKLQKRRVAESDAEELTVGVMIIGFFLVLLVAIAAPFLAGISNIMGLIIIFIGLMSAWKLNRAAPIVFSGPHPFSSLPPQLPPPLG